MPELRGLKSSSAARPAQHVFDISREILAIRQTIGITLDRLLWCLGAVVGLGRGRTAPGGLFTAVPVFTARRLTHAPTIAQRTDSLKQMFHVFGIYVHSE